MNSIISSDDTFVRQMSNEGSYSCEKQDFCQWSGIWKGEQRLGKEIRIEAGGLGSNSSGE